MQRGTICAFRFVCRLAVLGVSVASVQADVVNLSAVKDNTLYSNSDTLSNGGGDFFHTGTNANGQTRRALLAFDIAASIPAGSIINSATLTLYMSRTPSSDQPVALHRVLTDWGEGTSQGSQGEGGGAAATDDDATWRYTFFVAANPGSSPQWTSLGGDFSGVASASITVGGIDFYTWNPTAGMVADVQLWLDNPAANFGWILVGNESVAATAKRFNSRTHPTASQRPVLTVDFTPPGAFGACCSSNGMCQLLDGIDCTTSGASFQGDGTTCTPNPCPQPTGACCLGTGVCFSTTAADCSTQGVYQGDGATCTPNPCPVLTGACCFDSGFCGELSSVDCGLFGGTYQGDLSVCTTGLCPVVLAPFVDPLPIPPIATPTVGTPGLAATYKIEMVQVQQQLHRDLPPTTVWAYDGVFPGPTILATRDLPVTVEWVNNLQNSNGTPRTDHYLDVDLCPHGAQDLPKTVVHLHGGHVPAEFDGYPEDAFLPGNMLTYVYPNNQLPGLIWYHDHGLGITRLNVYMGLAGAYIIRDAFEDALGLPDGEFEVPLIIQDRTFNPDGSFFYPSSWQEHFFGDTILVNGMAWPFMEVKQGKYRFRMLNGSNSRTLTLSLSNNQGFQQIGTDGGLLPAPVELTELTLGPAERADLILDFTTNAAGSEIILTNSAPAPFPGTPGQGVVPNVMKFVVLGTNGFSGSIPAALRPLEVLDPANAVIDREFRLKKSSDPCTGVEWLINDLHWNDITEFPRLGTIETWTFVNQSGISHPMHIHLDFFQPLYQQSFQLVGPDIVTNGPREALPANLGGWKDTVMVPPGKLLKVAIRFEDYTGLFPYHCHILEHEDHEMMRQFRAVVFGDADVDGDVDLTDFAVLSECLNGPGVAPNPSAPPPTAAECLEAFDVDQDGDVDLGDAQAFELNFTN